MILHSADCLHDPARPPAARPAGRRPLRVLIIEDDAEAAQDMVVDLLRHGIDAEVITDGGEALKPGGLTGRLTCSSSTACCRAATA